MGETRKWSVNLKERRVIDAFWEWLLSNVVNDDYRIIDVNISDMLDQIS